MQNNTILTLFVGHCLVKLSEVDSTNSYLRKQLSNTKPLAEGTVIMADHQFAGRGQQSNVWEAEKGKNLTISILLMPTFLSLEHQFYLNKAVSLGINDCLQLIIGNDCKIKWPNDIYYKDHKLGGVLIENTTAGNNIKASIIGIGLNVNQKIFSQTIQNVTSISKILRQDYDLDLLLSQLCKCIEDRYLQLKNGDIKCLDEEYLNRLFRLGKVSKYLIGDKVSNGMIEGVNGQGCLLLRTDYELMSLDLKQVKFIFDSE